MKRIARALFISSLSITAGSHRLIAQDCNGNGIADACDIDCGAPGWSCDAPNCGLSEDRNGNNVPDECECQVNEQAKLTAADAAFLDRFGQSVAINSHTAVIGAYNSDGPDPGDPIHAAGSAYVFRNVAGAWQQIAKLTAGDPWTQEWFGWGVAVSNDTALIGAHHDSFSKGAAYVFREIDNVWQQIAKLTAADAAPGQDDLFGFSVALSGDTAVLGAIWDDDGGSNSGSAYVFREVGGVWQQIAKLTAADATNGDEFGSSVALGGDTAVIGARSDDDGGLGSGSAYVFREVGGTWQQIAKLIAADAARFDSFGRSVALSGDTAVIGARGDDDGGTNSGSAYVFREIGGVWQQIAKLTAADAEAFDSFGTSVSISGDTAIIGATANDAVVPGSGSAYVFREVAGVWRAIGKLFASDGMGGDEFGVGVAISVDTAVIGAHFNDQGDHFDAGAAYVFGGLSDCNVNAVLDPCDITSGTSLDQNADGIPDECNLPRVCDAGGPYVAACAGAVTTIALDGTASSDPDGDELAYLWSTTCPGGVFDDPTSPTPVLTIESDPGCLIECGVTLVVDDGSGASDTCSTSVAISDITPPEPACPADATVECGGDTSPASTGIATATDECSSAAVTYIDASTPGCGGTETITRTWTATDDCGNADSCEQTITVTDTTPPTITCPVDLTLECPAEDTSPASTGMATATDVCSTATVTHADAITPGCGGTQTITRTWTATDACGNTASCDQTITIVDTTPPTISCPADVTLVWGESTDPSATGMATGMDDCDPAAPAIAHSDVVTAPSCLADPVQETITRTWTATDACGNAASCDQTLTLLKRTASLIIKQGACPVPLNRNSHGVLPAVVTGDIDFDVTQIDASTVRLSRADCVGGSVAPNNGPPGPPVVIDDLNHPYVGPPPCSCNGDPTPDGLDDLSLKFRVDDLVEALELDALPDGAIVELCVTGALADGCQFRACDCVRLIAPGTPEALLAISSNMTGAWVDVTPLDNTLDGGGFTDFVRNFPETTVVTLSAEAIVNSKPLLGWMVDGQFIPANGAAPWLPSPTLKHTLIAGQSASVEALYGPPVKKSVPQPGPNIGPAGSSGFKTSGKP